jgi:hypothetical protein
MWESWINRNSVCYTYDEMLDALVEKFSEQLIGGSYEAVDKKQCITLWWRMNRNKFGRYAKSKDFAKKMKFHGHDAISYYTHKRKPSFGYDENTRGLRNFIKTKMYEVST